MTAVDEIKSHLDAIDLISETVKLRRSGKNYVGFCPFHPNSRTPAFVAFPDSGTWRCFGQCNEGGDIFKFVMKKEGWDFPETLRYLADKAGVQLEPQTAERQAEDEHLERLRVLMEDAVTFFRHHLLNTPAGKPALEYLNRRGLQPSTIEAFGLGYAPDTWDTALRYFTEKKYTQQELVRTGLVTERQDASGVYDRFRNRIMFPIRDGLGRMAGFGARILNPNDVPKFLNSPQTELFDKGRLLYGLDLARKAIRAQDQVVIVEGYLDVIALHQAGFTNVVSPMGTALTEDQLRLLKKFTRRIVLALDADAAGEKATLRGLEVARQALDKSEELAFDPRGLLRHEARLQADMRVTTLPEGMDPDEVVLRDPEEWKRILEDAKPIVVHVMEALAAGQNLEDAKVKSGLAAQVLPLIEDVPDPVERDTYRQRLARLLKVDERSLQSGTGVQPGGRPRRKPQLAEKPSRQTAAQQPLSGSPQRLAQAMEAHCLRLLLHQPEHLYNLDRTLQQAGLSRFSPQDMEFADHQALARLLLQSLEQDHSDPSAYLRDNLPESLDDMVQLFLAPLSQQQGKEPTADQRLEDLVRTFMNLRLIRVNEGIRQMRFLQAEVEAQAEGEGGLNPFQDLIVQYLQARSRLESAIGRSFQLD